MYSNQSRVLLLYGYYDYWSLMGNTAVYVRDRQIYNGTMWNVKTATNK